MSQMRGTWDGCSLIQSDNSPMKLATYQDGSRDGQLVVVSRNLSQAHYASQIANRLQQALDDWNYLSPQLQDLSDALNSGRARHAFPFDPRQCMAPLPRAFQWVEGFGYVSNTLPDPSACNAPELVQGSGANLLGACDPIVCGDEAWGVDFSAGLAAVTGDLQQDCTSDRALDGIRLLMLANAVTLRYLTQSKPCTAFSPVAVTPDELSEAWNRGRVHAPLQVIWNGRKVGLCDAGADMPFHFGRLLSTLAQSRPVRAGSIVGSGPVMNKSVERKGRTEWPNGYSSIAEKRAMETLQDGQPTTEFMRFGDTLRIEMKGRDGASFFGAIEQEVVPAANAARVSPASAAAQTP